VVAFVRFKILARGENQSNAALGLIHFETLPTTYILKKKKHFEKKKKLFLEKKHFCLKKNNFPKNSYFK